VAFTTSNSLRGCDLADSYEERRRKAIRLLSKWFVVDAENRTITTTKEYSADVALSVIRNVESGKPLESRYTVISHSGSQFKKF